MYIIYIHTHTHCISCRQISEHKFQVFFRTLIAFFKMMALMIIFLYLSFISEREIRSHVFKKVMFQNFLMKSVYINVLMSITVNFNGEEGEALFSYFSREFYFG